MVQRYRAVDPIKGVVEDDDGDLVDLIDYLALSVRYKALLLATKGIVSDLSQEEVNYVRQTT